MDMNNIIQSMNLKHIKKCDYIFVFKICMQDTFFDDNLNNIYCCGILIYEDCRYRYKSFSFEFLKDNLIKWKSTNTLIYKDSIDIIFNNPDRDKHPSKQFIFKKYSIEDLFCRFGMKLP